MNLFHLYNSGNKEEERKTIYLRTIIGDNTKKPTENCISENYISFSCLFKYLFHPV